MGQEYIKEFDRWNSKKKQADRILTNQQVFIYEREVWWCAVGVNLGSEIDGKNENFERPVLIIRVISEKGFLGLPLTSKKKGHQYEAIVHHTKGVSFANVSQIKFFSKKRLLRKIGTIDEVNFEKVAEQLRKLF